MASDEEKVRAVWHSVSYDGHRALAAMPNRSKAILSGNINYPFEKSNHLAPAEAWSAAWTFTEHRLEEIRLVREEIALIGDLIDGADMAGNTWHSGVFRRTLAAREQYLATLCAGMKATQDGAAAREGNG